MDNSAVPQTEALGRPTILVTAGNPQVSDLVARLIAQEYEAVVLADPQRWNAVLAQYPRAVVFVDIDSGIPEPEWEARLRAVAEDPADLVVGVMTAGTDPEVGHKYLFDLGLTGGLVRLGRHAPDPLAAVVQALEAVNARGRRQYLRVPCQPGDGSLIVAEGPQVYRADLVDVSSVGFACVFEAEPPWSARTLVKGIQLKLRGVLCACNAVVMGSRLRDDGARLHVLLFDPASAIEARAKVQTFQRKELQSRFDANLASEPSGA